MHIMVYVYFMFACCCVVFTASATSFVDLLKIVAVVNAATVAFLRPHSIILASCKPGFRPGLQPVAAPGGGAEPRDPAVPRQLSYSDVDHKQIIWLRA